MTNKSSETPQYDAVEQQLVVRGEKTAELPFYHTECEGLILPPFMKKEQAGIYANSFNVRPRDVFIASFPKSGTNWLTYVVQQIANPIPPSQEYMSVGGAIPYMESSTLEQLEGYPSPRYMYTHLPCHLMPHGNEQDVKYLVIARNPKDVAVSQFHFMSSFKLLDFTGSWEEFLNLFLKGRTIYGSYFDHVLAWWKHKDDDNVLFLRYEDLKKDLKGQIGVIANFLNFNHSQEELEKIAEKCTFKAMKSNPDVSTATLEQHKDKLFKKKASLLRKGIVGDWKNHFSDEQLEKFNSWCNSHLEGTGLEFDFG